MRVVLTANHDAPRTGLLYWRPARRGRRRGRRRLRLSNLVGPVDIAFWALCAALVAAAVRLITGTDSTFISVVQFVPTVILMAYVVLFIDVAMSPVAEGANGNASGVATLLEVGRRLERQGAQAVDVWLVFPAAKEGFMLGMRAWMRAHAEDIDPRYTFFVNVDSVGAGTVHHVTAEGFALINRHDRNLIRICERIGSRPRTWREGTDGVLPAMQGFPSITLCSADERGRVPHHKLPLGYRRNVDPEAVEAAVDFVHELVRRIDRVVLERVEGAEAPPSTKGADDVLQ